MQQVGPDRSPLQTEDAGAIALRTRIRALLAPPASPGGASSRDYSYWSASRTLSREARRAGRTAARIPATTATTVKITSCVKGTWNEMPWLASPACPQRGVNRRRSALSTCRDQPWLGRKPRWAPPARLGERSFERPGRAPSSQRDSSSAETMTRRPSTGVVQTLQVGSAKGPNRTSFSLSRLRSRA